MIRFVDYRAHLFAKPTIHTFLHIHFRIPETFIVGFKSYRLLAADIATGITAAAIYFILNIYHKTVTLKEFTTLPLAA